MMYLHVELTKIKEFNKHTTYFVQGVAHTVQLKYEGHDTSINKHCFKIINKRPDRIETSKIDFSFRNIVTKNNSIAAVTLLAEKKTFKIPKLINWSRLVVQFPNMNSGGPVYPITKLTNKISRYKFAPKIPIK